MRHDATYVTDLLICTPSAAILCGTHNHVNLCTTLSTHTSYNPDCRTLPPKHLRAGGYRTALS